jgi:hypothetical protein
MILPTGTTVAVADGETVRLFHNTGVKPGVHLVEITAAPPAPAHCAPSHRLCQPRWQAARRGRLRGSDGRVPEQAQPRRDHKTPGRCLRPQDLGGDAQALPPRPERQDHRRVREGLQPASARGHRLIDRRHLTRLRKRLPAQARPVIICSNSSKLPATTTALDQPEPSFPGSLTTARTNGRPDKWKSQSMPAAASRPPMKPSKRDAADTKRYRIP